jgi:hypothetical protein
MQAGAGQFEVMRVSNNQARGAGVGVKIGFQPNDDYVGGNVIGASISAVNTSGTDTNNIDLVFGTGASGTESERMRLNSSGNLGLGVTPNTWSALKAIQIAGGASLGGFSNVAFLNANAYFDGSWRYIATTGSGRYEVADAHKWFTAPSGTAGNAITFTQAMTLDASGNLIVGGTTAQFVASNRANITLAGTSEAILGFGIGGTSAGYLYHTGTNMDLYNGRNGYLGFSTNATERMRIDSSGNVGIGTTATTTYRATIANNGGNQLRLYATDVASSTTNTIDFWYLDGGGSPYNNTSIRSLSTANAGNGNLAFYTRPTSGSLTEAMRIDSSGNLLVGTTTQADSGKQSVRFNGQTQKGIGIQDIENASGARFISFVGAGGGSIGSIERVTTTNAVVYNTTSDLRLKSNIVDADPVLDKLLDVKVRQFDWTKGDLHQDAGFIAQELAPVLSGIVTKGKTEEDMWQLDYSRLTPYLVKAIQEQQAIINDLKARIETLESK